VIEHLKSVDGGPRWAEAVVNYLKLESQYPSRVRYLLSLPAAYYSLTTTQGVGRLSLRSRPQEAVDWGQRRDSFPAITNVKRFHAEWVAWWISCQPKWRTVEMWPYSHDDADDKDWARLNVTGPHGLFALVVSASWWAGSMGSDPLRVAFSAAIDDLHWALERLVSINIKSQQLTPKPKTAPVSRFPGHGERDPSKRKVKPSSKACNRS